MRITLRKIFKVFTFFILCCFPVISDEAKVGKVLPGTGGGKDKGVARTIYPSETSGGSTVNGVNLFSGKAGLEIPLGNLSAGNGVNVDFSLSYCSVPRLIRT